MTLDQAIAEVQQIAGWRQDKVTEITAALRNSQAEREKPGRTYPWFLKGNLPIVTVPGTVIYNISTSYIQDTDERDGNLYYYLGTLFESRPIFLKKWSLKDLQQKYLGVWPSSSSDPLSDVAPAGAPTDYTLDAGSIYVYPIPDAAYTILWNCWAKAAPQALGQENAWLANAPWLLIGDAAKKICSDLKYAEGVSAAAEIIATAEANLFRAVIHRQEAGRKRRMGSRL